MQQFLFVAKRVVDLHFTVIRVESFYLLNRDQGLFDILLFDILIEVRFGKVRQLTKKLPLKAVSPVWEKGFSLNDWICPFEASIGSINLELPSC